jgi:hypothetical protein
MGHIGTFTPWKLVIGVLFAGKLPPASLKPCLEEAFGPVDYESRILPFTYTDYYKPEMGDSISRCFMGFKNAVQPDLLADIKIATNRIEERYLAIISADESAGRTVNLDPGLLSLSRFILATTKDNSHRIPLAKGIYAELTLRFLKKDFQTLPWTYPDYATREYRDILKEIRAIYKESLKQEGSFFCN